MNYRRVSRWLGLVDFAVVGGFLAVVGVPKSVGIAFPLGCFLVAGVLFVLAGFDTPLTALVGWHRLCGAAYFLLAVALVLNATFGFLRDEGATFSTVWMVGFALVLGFIGVDLARGGRHVEIDPDETV